MRILAIDPGFSYGWAVLEDYQGEGWIVIDSGSGKAFSPEEAWQELIGYTPYRDEYVWVVEQQPLVAVKSGIVAHGLQALAWQRSRAFVQIPSSRVKKLVAGSGRATKEQVKEVVEERFGVECANYHESDAIGVGLAYIIMEEKNGTDQEIAA